MNKFSLIILLFLFFTANSAIAAGNYLNELTAIRPFEKIPIKIWIQDSSYKSTMYPAFNEWVRASGSCVKFTEVQAPKAAQIRITFVTTLSGNAAGVTTPYSIGNNTIYADIKIAVYPAGATKPITKQQAFAVAVHEIGHALGMQGHSSNRNDIMYPDTSVIGIYASARDYNSIKQIYCKKPVR